ncbi:DUF2062 domain-containing protein [Rhodoferax sp.]|uniref:DUF2062 domain-containing protein n=1 Tax=Rhodoferax sp. TaxID=50421 RepID=UPI00374D5D86
MASYAYTLRHWLRGLEPKVLNHLHGPMLERARPWLDRHEVFNFNRRPLALGVAIGMFCGLIPGPLQVPATFVLCAWWRGNAIAGVLVTCYTNPLTIVPLYLLAFQIGQWVLPGSQVLPPLPTMGTGAADWMHGLADWVQAMGWPLLVGLPLMGAGFAVIAYAAMQTLWLSPAIKRAWQLEKRARRHK